MIEMADQFYGRSHGEGIPIDFFCKNCSFLQGTLDSIVRRILMASGLDISNERTLVDWQHYLTLFCTFSSGRIDKQTLVKFWVKFFDQFGTGFCE
jgi:hypothetical protein